MSDDLELWAKVEPSEGVYTHAVYDKNTDRFYWYEKEVDARDHHRIGRHKPPETSVGRRYMK